ncbi:hypothetical protein PT279_01045 [Bifidobacterium sp. ESL0784]|uniref:hypothetical protein n=1 Tax=Bifidobacterium sp. ESL0784 TaxID=2983231 RepID=UPI0023F9F287|nr:hypothetical protein [Bifidobacterium sp. ESL0784]MDF7640184.1 hypothetical protein [Bifidobacterium sp. ESL0784]
MSASEISLTCPRGHRLFDRKLPVWFPSLGLLAVTMLLCAVSSFFSSLGSLSGFLTCWSSFTVACREGVLLPSLVIGVMTFLVGRNFGPSNVIVGRVASRGTRSIWLHHVIRLVVAVIVGYTIGFIPLLVRLSANATWGSVDWWALPDSYSVLIFFVAFGMVLALVCSRPWGVMVVPAALLLASVCLRFVNEWVLVNTGYSSLMLSPIWGDENPYLGYQVSISTHVMRILFFSMLVLLVVCVATRILDGNTLLLDSLSGVWAVAISCMLVFVIAIPQKLVIPEPFSQECAVTEMGVKLCLHPADARARRELAPLVDKVAGLTGTERSVYSEWVTGKNPIGISFNIDDDGHGNLDTEQILTQLTGQIVFPDDRCTKPGVNSTAAGLVHRELERRVGMDVSGSTMSDGEAVSPNETLGHGFRAMSDAQFAAWFKEHRQLVASCAITEKDLP